MKKKRYKIKSRLKLGIISVVLLAVIASGGASLLALTGFFGGSGSESSDLTRGLVGHWTMDDSGGVLVQDQSGQGNDGMINDGGSGNPVSYWDFEDGSGQTVTDRIGSNNATRGVTASASTDDPTWTSGGRIGNALEYDGDTDTVEVPDSNSLTFGDGTNDSAFSFSIWIKPKIAGTYGVFTKDRVGAAGSEYYSEFEQEKITVGLRDQSVPTTSSIATTTRVPVGEWTFFVFTYNGTGGATAMNSGNAEVYVNGVKEAAPTRSNSGTYVAMENTVLEVVIGGYDSGTAGFRSLNGFIDDVRLYDYELTAASVNRIYNESHKSKWVPGVAEVTNGGAGNALVFDGVDDHIITSTTNDYSVTNRVTLATWYKIDSKVTPASGTTNNVITIKDAYDYTQFGWQTTTDKAYCQLDFQSPNSATTVVSDDLLSLDTWYHQVCTYDGANVILYVNGVEANRSAVVKTLHAATDVAIIGALASSVGGGGSVRFFNGSIDDVRIYNRALSADEIRRLHNGRGPVAHYKFDEGSGRYAYDSSRKSEDITTDLELYLSMNDDVSGDGETITDVSGNSNDGTTDYGGNTTGMDCTVAGNSGQGCDLDGTDDYISVADGSSLDITDAITISAWVQADANGDSEIVSKKETGGYALGVDTDKYRLRMRLDTTYYDLTSTSLVSTYVDQWLHLSATFDGTTWKIYFNGVLDNQTTQAGSIDTNNVAVLIGAEATAGAPAAGFFNGTIDDVYIFSRALTANEVKYLYNLQNNDGTLGDATCQAAAGTCPTWSTDNAPGSTGGSLSFDGSADYINVDDNDNFSFGSGTSDEAFSVSAWFKKDTLTGSTAKMIVGKYDGSAVREWGFRIDNDKPSLILYDESANAYQIAAHNTNSITAGQWYHTAATYDGSGGSSAKNGIKIYLDGVQVNDYTDSAATYTAMENTAVDVSIGAWAAGADKHFDGEIDDVRIYNYARTQDQIRLDYNAGLAAHFGGTPDLESGLVGHWKLDEMAGTSAIDASGNGNTGTLTNNPTWTSGAPSQGLSGGAGALEFDGVDDYVVSATTLPVSLAAASMSVWFKPDDVINAGYQRIIGNGGCYYCLRTTGTTLQANTYDGTNDLVTLTSFLTAGQWYHAVVTWDSTTLRLYVDGIEKGNTPAGAPTVGTILYVGSNAANPSGLFNGTIDDVRVYNRALSAEEVRYLYNNNGPVAHWTFDEGSGTTAYDSAGSNDGTLTAMEDADWVSGKYGGALDFDGSAEYVKTGSSAILAPTTAITVEAWYNQDAISGTPRLVSFSGADSEKGYLLRAVSDGIYFHIYNGSTYVNVKTPAVLALNIWHHIVATYDKQNIKMYIDGVLVATTSETNDIAYTLPTELYIGVREGLAAAEFFDGQIDDVKVYNYARTTEQIRSDYNAGLAVKFGGTPDLERGLVGHWNFDQMVGTTATDVSVNSNDGTLTNNPTWTQGVNTSTSYHGLSGGAGALDFDGVNDYVDAGGSNDIDSITGDLTLSAWVNSEGTSDLGLVISTHNGLNDFTRPYDLLVRETNRVDFIMGNGVAQIGATSGSTTLVLNTWYHIAGTISGTSMTLYVNGVSLGTNTFSGTRQTGTKVIVGASTTAGSRQFNGTIDDPRIYNRALSAEEVRYLYNNNGPVAHWKFDENAGTTAYDSAGSNDGTLTTMTDADWVSGKFGNALDFDGSSDYITSSDAGLPDAAEAFTIGLWVKSETFTGGVYQTPISYGTATTNQAVIVAQDGINNDGTLIIGRHGNDILNSLGGLTLNSWNYITLTYDGTTVRLYLDGVFDSLVTATLTTVLDAVSIGKLVGATQYFDGFIDDVKIYNYARTAEQVRSDYNAGKSLYFR